MQYQGKISQKLQNDLSLFPRKTIQHHSSSGLCPNTNATEGEIEPFYENLQDLLKLTPKRDVLSITGDQNAKAGSQETLE